MKPPRESRPSTANTMLLVLKPRPVEYSPNANLSIGSDNEREAWRKNRVIQMKLGAYLTEVHQQQRSSARLLKTEEYRFLQEAMRRSGVPRSVTMLDQLHFFRDKSFPERRFSTDWHFRDGRHPHHKHPPLSARPLRPHRQKPLLNRPKTSATLYTRKNINEEDEYDDPTIGDYVEESNMNSTYNILVDSNGRHVASVSAEQRQDLPTTNQARFEPDVKQTTELPPIKLKDSKENLQPLDILQDNEMTHTSILRKTDVDKELHKNFSHGTERTSKLEQLSSQIVKNSDSLRQRRESAGSSRAVADNKNNTLSRVNSFINPIPQIEIDDRDLNNNSVIDMDVFGSSLREDEIEKEFKNIRVSEFLEKQAIQDMQCQQQHQQQQQQQNQNQNQQQQEYELVSQGVSAQFAIDGKPDEDIERQDSGLNLDMIGTGQVSDATQIPQKRLLRQNTKINFNRIKHEPVMPLRHNITSVLRQERTKFEASQKKVKDYLHTMSSRDSISRHPSVISREHSAQSRKSAGRKDEHKSDLKFSKKIHP